MARHEGREAATPVVRGEQLDPPKYGELWSDAASRAFFASYREYEQRVEFANAEGLRDASSWALANSSLCMCNGASQSTITSDRGWLQRSC